MLLVVRLSKQLLLSSSRGSISGWRGFFRPREQAVHGMIVFHLSYILSFLLGRQEPDCCKFSPGNHLSFTSTLVLEPRSNEIITYASSSARILVLLSTQLSMDFRNLLGFLRIFIDLSSWVFWVLSLICSRRRITHNNI